MCLLSRTWSRTTGVSPTALTRESKFKLLRFNKYEFHATGTRKWSLCSLKTKVKASYSLDAPYWKISFSELYCVKHVAYASESVDFCAIAEIISLRVRVQCRPLRVVIFCAINMCADATRYEKWVLYISGLCLAYHSEITVRFSTLFR